MSEFAHRIIRWQRRSGRHGLPWQGGNDPYPIWVSEIMLQQTQVASAAPYFLRFMARFPTVAALAAAPLQSVLESWAGLGYYSRARNLHAAACHIQHQWGGVFPRDPAELEQLPGVGRSTAGAIAALTWGVRAPILDGNAKRVLCRVFGVEGATQEPRVQKALWQLAEELLPDSELRAYTQGLMDLGATLCTRSRPRCEDCPVRDSCVARRDGRTAELPTPRNHRALPLRTAEWVLLACGDAVLLEERVPRGLWGGLLSLPECVPPSVGQAPDPDVALCLVKRWLVERLAGQDPPATIGEHAEVRHRFTHFVLRARVWSIVLAGEAPVSNPPGMATPETGSLRWVPVAELPRVALPSPVRRLLLADH